MGSAFGFYVVPGSAERQALMLAGSIRSFGGGYAESDLIACVPEGMSLSAEARDALLALGVRVTSFVLPEPALTFPLAGKAFAAAHAESLLGDGTNLVWIDRDCIIVQPPAPLMLPDGKELGYRPVDHTLIGSVFGQPLDAFWQTVYRECGADESAAFPLATAADGQTLRAYFNAGIIVTRPANGLLHSWAANFERLYLSPQLARFYQGSSLYRIFAHQAVLTATVLARVSREKMVELPRYVNYPLNLHGSYPAEFRPASLNDVVSFRYDTLFDEHDYAGLCDRLPIDEPLRSWIGEHLRHSGNPPGGAR